MDTRFEIMGYQLDVICPETKKYLGSIDLAFDDEDRPNGYQGRKMERLDTIGHKATRKVKFKGLFLTELVPICGKVLGDKHKTIQEAHEWRNQFGSDTRNL